MYFFQKLQNQKPKKGATGLNESKIKIESASNSNNNAEETLQDSVIKQGKISPINLEVFHLLYLVFLEWEISDTNKRSSSSPPTAQALKIITLEKEIKILVFTKQSLCVIT